MSRGRSTKLLATLPDDYSTDWLEKLDKRTKVARAVLSRIAELESDAGGAESLSAARRSLIRHAAWLDAMVESHELQVAAGEQVDAGAYTQSLNSLLGLYRLIGLERKSRPVRTLREIMNEGPSQRPAGPTEKSAPPAGPVEPSAAPGPSGEVTEGAQ